MLKDDVAMRTLAVFMDERYLTVASLAEMLGIDEPTAEDALTVLSVVGVVVSRSSPASSVRRAGGGNREPAWVR